MIQPREATEQELKELEDFIVAARKSSDDTVLSEATAKSEVELAQYFIANAAIGVFKFGWADQNFDGRILVGIWPTNPMNASIFIWQQGQLVEFYHCVGGPGIISIPM